MRIALIILQIQGGKRSLCFSRLYQASLLKALRIFDFSLLVSEGRL